MKKVIQIATFDWVEAPPDLFAVTDEGSIYKISFGVNDAEWEKLPDIKD